MPSVVIMALNPEIPERRCRRRTRYSGGAPPVQPGVRRLPWNRGGNGGRPQAQRRSGAPGAAATIAYLKNPKPPMPKMYPDLLTDQSIIDVTDYLYQQWGHHD